MTEPSSIPVCDLDTYQRVLDALDEPTFVKDRQHRWVMFNEAFCRLLGRSREELLGKSDPDIFPPDVVEVFWRLDDELFETGESNENEENVPGPDGQVQSSWTRKYPVRGPDGQVVGLIGIITDISALRRRHEELEALERERAEQRARLEAQQQLIDAMEVPVINLWEGVLLVPLVGEISPHRAQLVLERMLAAIAAGSIKRVLLEISGVPSMTESSAAPLLSAVSAARLLGARADIVGISPQIAQVLVGQGVRFEGVQTYASLHDALRDVRGEG